MRSILAVSILVLLLGCSKEYSVMDELSVGEVRRLIDQDSLYEHIISEADMTRRMIKDNIVLTSKFLELTYSSYLSYKKAITDSSLLASIEAMTQHDYQERSSSLVASYRPRIDSLMQEYKNWAALSNPERYFSVDFYGIDKEYYSNDSDVRSINIKFRITPLRGAIEGGSFEYRVIPKSTGRSIASGGCRFSQKTREPTTYIWEAPYDVEREFKSITPLRIVERYSFEFSINTARVNGNLFTSDNESGIPFSFRSFLDVDTLSNDACMVIIKDVFSVETDSPDEIFDEYLLSEKKNINQLAFEFEQLTVLSKLQQAIGLIGGD
jgi:hypothetical protein